MKILHRRHLFALTCAAAVLLAKPAIAALGNLDPGFNPQVNGVVRIILIQPDGRILIAGDFTAVNSTPQPGFARLHADGSLDTGFRPSEWPAGWPSSLALRPDGRIVAGKGFGRVIQLGPDGAVESFGPDIAEDVEEDDPDYRPSVRHVLVQPDGKTLFAGYFTRVNGVVRTGLARLQADGTLDSQFNPVIDYSEEVGPLWHLALQRDGKILISGDFHSVNGHPRSDFARLNPDGTLDEGFSRAAEALKSSEYFVALPDGKILMGRSRLNGDGSLDSGFVPDLGWIEPIVVQPDGEILAAAGPVLSRLTENGSRDTNFNARVSGGYLHAIGLQSDGKVILAGDFTEVNGAPRPYLARVLGQPANEVTVSPLSMKSGQPGFDIASVTPRTVVIEGSTNLVHWEAVQSLPVGSDPVRFSDTNHRSHPRRFYRVGFALFP